MNKLFLFSILFIGWCAGATARQNNASRKQVPEKIVKYGQISQEDFEAKPAGNDSAASAVVLFDKGKGQFELSLRKMGFIYILERHIRIKIMNKTGYDYANLEVPLFNFAGNETDLYDMDGATYNMENGKMVVSKITKASKFTERQDKNFTIKKFALPNVKEGSIVEFRYKVQSDFLFTLMPWYFQKDIPVLYSEFDISIPQIIKYKITQGGSLNIDPLRQLSQQKFRFYGEEASVQVVRNIYRAENLSSMKPEKFMTTLDDYIGKVEFELNSIAMPGTSFLDYIKTWPKIVQELKQSGGFGGFLAPKDNVKKIVQGIIKPDMKPDTIPFVIFDYVKKNVKWNKMNNIYGIDKGPEDVLEKKTGNSADINLTLLALLREANVDANPIILSTRSNGRHPGTPMISKFNNVIIDVKLGEQHIFFDATNKNHTPDIVDFENLNHEGLKVDFANNSGSWINTVEFKVSRKTVNGTLTLNGENKLTGTMHVLTTNYEALTHRNQYINALNEEAYLKQFRTDKPGLGIKNYKIENLDDPAMPLFETMDVMIEDNVEETGNLIYFSPLLFEKTKENPFVIENRKYPVDFGYPIEETYRVTIEIPKDYILDKLPQNEKISLLDNAASFSFVVSQEENRISVVSKISFQKAVYSVQEYHDLKELFSNVVRKQAEQIVIKKS